MIPFLLEMMMQMPYQADDAALDAVEEKDCK